MHYLRNGIPVKFRTVPIGGLQGLWPVIGLIAFIALAILLRFNTTGMWSHPVVPQ
jgi:hypothetical protein